MGTESKELMLVDATRFGLEQTEGQEMQSAFAPMVKQRDSLAEVYEMIINQELSPELAKKARRARLDLRKTRTNIAKIHKAQKAYFLAGSKFVDAIKNKLTEPITQMEEKLSEIEKYEEIRQQKIIQERYEERVLELSKYTDDIPKEIGSFSDKAYQSYLTGVKLQWEEAEAKRKEEERLAKERAEAEAKERERLRKENEALLQQQKEAQAKIEAERKARLKAEAEAQAIKEAEAMAEELKRAKEQEKLNKGDEDKIGDLIKALENIKTNFEFKSDKYKELHYQVSILMDKTIGYINSKIK